MSRRKKSKSRTLAVVIQDKSASMQGRTPATISGYNEYVDSLKDLDSEVLLTLCQFNHGIHEAYTSISVAEAPALDTNSYQCGGSTSLLDAIGKTLRSVEKTAKPNDKVMVIIMTDGEENTSREYAHSAIMDLLEKKRGHGWEFVFLGAGEDSWDTGQTLGFNNVETVFYNNDPHAHRGVYASLANTTDCFVKEGKEGKEASIMATKMGFEGQAAKELWKEDEKETAGGTRVRKAAGKVSVRQ